MKMESVGSIKVREFGGAEKLDWEISALPDCGANEAIVRHTAVGLNFIDIYHRSGLYPIELPSALGLEASGVVEHLGSEVSGLSVGDRVVCATGPLGAYSEKRVCPADCLVQIPDDISDDVAAAGLLKGMTAEYLLERLFQVGPAHTVLIHAAGGAVGHMAVAWAKHLGAKVFGTAGSDSKLGLAREAGCDVAIDYSREDFAQVVMNHTDNQGVDVVYDSVGKTTLEGSLQSLKYRGLLASFGQSSGAVPYIELKALAQKSLFVTRPSLFHYVRTREELVHSAERVFDMIRKKVLKITINQTYALKEAAKAHQDLEDRKLTGSTILVP